MVTHEAEYRALTERAVKTQEATALRSVTVNDQFVELDRRLSSIEHILKDTG